jgi:hypothetical protein
MNLAAKASRSSRVDIKEFNRGKRTRRHVVSRMESLLFGVPRLRGRDRLTRASPRREAVETSFATDRLVKRQRLHRDCV